MSTRKPADTPLMRQYLEAKSQHPDAILFFRLGDFYEMFFEDAVLVARTLELTLTTRDKGHPDAVPMCGVPHHAAAGYVKRLVELGHKIAICEQVEDPRLARGIVRREVVRIVTPGVVLDEDQLEPKAEHLLGAVAKVGARFGLAILDVTTGEFRAAEVGSFEALSAEIVRNEPRELLCGEGIDVALCKTVHPRCAYAVLEAPPEDPVRALAEGLAEDPRALGLEDRPAAAAAAASALRYARATQPAGTLPVVRLALYEPADHLVLDETSRANLELTETMVGRDKRGSLLAQLDETRTAMGGRLLRRMLLYPSRRVAEIRRRQDAIELLVERHALRDALSGDLAEVYDLERLAGRITLRIATPRDLGAIRASLRRAPGLFARLAEATGAEVAPPELLAAPDDLVPDALALLEEALCDEPPPTTKEGGFIRAGFDATLDELVAVSSGGKDLIAAIEARERERTGIATLKVKYNRVFGYYLEVTRAQLKHVPADYQRKQTVAGAERFVTPELADLEQRVLGAEEKRIALEIELHARLLAALSVLAPRLSVLGGRLALLDAMVALAEVAHRKGWARPEVDDGGLIELGEGRHPVVEAMVPRGAFVPNDVLLDPAGAQILLITGPNMAGKSTVMRQVALIVLLAQMGSFVPARSARIGCVDRIFTRVGAADNLARGESTFMVEMRETAAILRHATARSLVLLDEIGRGTSTYDGVSIAWAVAEQLHERVGAKTLFATHYHELTSLSRTLPRLRNFNIAVREWRDEIVFLRQLVPGAASRSYGIQVARLAGVPRGVIARATEILRSLETGQGPEGLRAERQQDLFAPPAPTGPVADLGDALGALDVEALTPLQALNWLADWKSRLG